ncbi:DNA primase, partial [Staphylococcus epidermidis]
NDTVLMEMMIKVFHIKRFNSELFIFKANEWQKINGYELQDLISKMIQVLLVEYKPSLSTLKNVVDGLQKSTDVEELVENEHYIG